MSPNNRILYSCFTMAVLSNFPYPGSSSPGFALGTRLDRKNIDVFQTSSLISSCLLTSEPWRSEASFLSSCLQSGTVCRFGIVLLIVILVFMYIGRRGDLSFFIHSSFWCVRMPLLFHYEIDCHRFAQVWLLSDIYIVIVLMYSCYSLVVIFSQKYIERMLFCASSRRKHCLALASLGILAGLPHTLIHDISSQSSRFLQLLFSYCTFICSVRSFQI